MKLDSLDLFFGDANPAQARVYVRGSAGETNGAEPSQRFAGRLIGPECAFARTLPARIPFANHGEAGGMLSEAVIPDPCFWTPELPFLYRAQLELQQGDRTIEHREQIFGLRRLAVRNKALCFDGNRFVLRGARATAEADLEAAANFARETWTALMVAHPTEAQCEFASRQGVLLVANMVEPLSSNLLDELRRLASWPAVAVALLSADAELPGDIHKHVPNLLLAQKFVVNRAVQLAPWAQLAFIETSGDLALLAQTVANCAVPVVAVGLGKSNSIEESRAACDALQTQLASLGEFAGYLA